MAEESDSGSIHSTVSDQSTDKKSSDQKRYYALYTFYPNRPRSIGDASSLEGTEQSEDGNLSLSIAATNLSASAETDLRKSLAQRLSRTPSSSGHGNFLSIGISSTDEVTSSAACYYCVLKDSSSSAESDLTSETSPNRRKFVVCFVSFFDSSLDLYPFRCYANAFVTFRQDLDTYCDGLLLLLDDESLPQDCHSSGKVHWQPSEMTTACRQLSQLNTGVKTYLEGWHETVLDYLTRCILRLGSENVQYLIYSALVDATLQISGASAREEEDIKKFVSCCSLSPLLEQLQTSDQENAGIGSPGESWQVQPGIIPLTISEDGAVFDTKSIESCHFCKLASDHLATIDPKNVTKVRDSLESVKLAFIHNLNKLKRFLRQAELDHYALYRSFVFLKKCGSGNLLLRYVKLDASAETLKVLTALEKFIREKGIQFA
ncbi:protein Njmu-R1-like [Littorina saxatilis]|uniref:protein Njmu-R1-like n=1 Tax=Littorina saxatilis TaxID=31220 RepID=UPI0038B478C8